MTLAVLLAVGLVSAYSGPLCAQATGPEGQKGRVSGPGELQANPKEELMDPGRPTPPLKIKGEIHEMEKQLAHPFDAGSGGNTQPSFDLVQSASPQQGKGEQVRRTPAALVGASTASHLNLVLRITDGGDAEVLTATEIAGEATVSNVPIGDFVYEVMSDRGTLAVETLQDPFERRSFPGALGSPTQGHHIERAKTAIITVKVPETALSSKALDKLHVRLHSIKAGPPLAEINVDVLRKLAQEGRLERRVDFSGGELAKQILQKGRALRPPQ
jgi:hypothetical protein